MSHDGIVLLCTEVSCKKTSEQNFIILVDLLFLSGTPLWEPFLTDGFVLCALAKRHWHKSKVCDRV
jgi:hypothetical protein